MELQNVSGVNNQINSLKNDKNLEKQEAQQERPQLKEHCSSKAANALRGMALGLALAAGVACSKGMVVQAADNNSSDVQNNTNITQEVEVNTQKSEVEMMADELLKEQSSSTLHVKNKVSCDGEMTETRNYEKAEITSDGQLVFYDKETSSKMSTGYQLNYNGKYEVCTRMHSDTTYSPQNAFVLGAEVNDGSIDLQPGARFSEADEKNGDYVELAEDGKTFNVYDSSGKQIGSCQFETAEEYSERLGNAKIAAGAMAVAGLGAAAGSIIAIKNGKL